MKIFKSSLILAIDTAIARQVAEDNLMSLVGESSLVKQWRALASALRLGETVEILVDPSDRSNRSRLLLGREPTYPKPPKPPAPPAPPSWANKPSALTSCCCELKANTKKR